MMKQSVEREKVRSIVVRLLSDAVDIPPERIQGSDRLLDDLRLISDDFSLGFVPDLEAELGVKIPVQAWDHVWTVDDAVRVASEALETR